MGKIVAAGLVVVTLASLLFVLGCGKSGNDDGTSGDIPSSPEQVKAKLGGATGTAPAAPGKMGPGAGTGAGKTGGQ